MIDITNALQSLAPGARWTLNGLEYQNLEWLDTTKPKPTESEINAEIDRLQAEYEAKQYQRDRAASYPSVVDQLDMLYHGGYDAWKAAIQAVKDKYPKGSV